MTAKRFRVNELVKYNYSEIGEYIDENHTDRPLRNDILVELLNELHKENQSLKFQLDECQNHKLYSRRELEKENEQLKKQIGNLEHTRDFADEVCADCERLEHENERLKKSNASTLKEFRKMSKRLQQLAKENEQLKQEN